MEADEADAPFAASQPCPSCGGAGGGPFGRAGSAWDDEGYLCPRCKGAGVLPLLAEEPEVEAPATPARPGIVKTTPEPAVAPSRTKRKASA